MIGPTGKIIQEKPLHVMFTTVPTRYDLINRLITWGFDEHWRREAVKECLASKPGRMLDLCCGTGDLALNVVRMGSNGGVAITGIDYSQPMLDIAAKKAKHLDSEISFVCGDADGLPFPDGSFDCVGISFAFRNLTYRNPLADSHVAEVFRVLRKGGRFVIVESSQPSSKFIRKLFHLYLRWFVFRVGYLLSGNRGAYHYLAESAARFYTPEELKLILIDAGFREVSYRPLFLGAAGIHVAIK